jgi:hypothetical protein
MSGTTDKRPSGLPPDRIVILNGRVQLVEEWTFRDWDIMCVDPCMVLQIGREADWEVSAEHGEFFSRIGVPEHSNRPIRGTLTEVIAVGLCSKSRERHQTLFTIRNADESSIRELGFSDYEVEKLTTGTTTT